MFLGIIVLITTENKKVVRITLREERTEDNKHLKPEQLLHVVEPHTATYQNTTPLELKEGDVVWFTLCRPCGEKDLVDTIRKPIFDGQ